MVYETTSRRIKIVYPKRKCLTCDKDMKVVSKGFNTQYGLTNEHVGVGGFDYTALVHYKCPSCNKLVYMRYDVDEEFGQ